jgi:hypothetical protein
MNHKISVHFVIRDRFQQLEELESHSTAILKSLTERNLLTTEMEEKIAAVDIMSVLEDIYQPFRPSSARGQPLPERKIWIRWHNKSLFKKKCI